MRISEVRDTLSPNAHMQVRKEVFEPLRSIDSGLMEIAILRTLSRDTSITPLKNMEHMIAEQKDGSNEAGIGYCNVWPKGSPTKDTYPRFIALCGENETLPSALNAIRQQSKKMAGLLNNIENNRKTIIMLTNKWDSIKFREYDRQFLQHTLCDNITYIFLLVSDYGCTQIPFLPNDRRVLQELELKKVEDDVTFKEILRRLQGMPIEYSVTGGVWKENDLTEYVFSADYLKWEKKTISGKSGGDINEKMLHKFLKEVLWISETAPNEVISNVSASDAPISTLHIFGRTVEWDVPNSNEKSIIALQNSLGEFIKACEKPKK